jgi:beta-phosphoglucomutase-like phosphatase (HAD superfamily)
MHEIKQNIKAVIFDMDGTVVNTEKAWQQITMHVLRMYLGIENFTQEQRNFLHTLSGMGLTNAATAVKSYFNLKQSINEITAQKIKATDVYLFKDVEFMEGFEHFHTKLQTVAVPTGLATNADPLTLQKMSQCMELDKFFGSHLYCSGDVGNKHKPDPAVFLHTAQKLGAQPDECVVFEDSLAGFKAAQAAGMKCIALKNNLNHNQLDQVDQAINSYFEAEEAIKKLF